MRYPALTAIILAAAMTGGCSTQPRAFAPQLAAAPADDLTYQQSLARCQQAARGVGGKAVGTKVAKGAGAAAVGGATVGGASWGAAAAAGAASVVALPVVGIVWALSRGERSKKERRIKQATAACLESDGYSVAGWERIPKPGKSRRTDAEGQRQVVAEAPSAVAEPAADLAPQ